MYFKLGYLIGHLYSYVPTTWMSKNENHFYCLQKLSTGWQQSFHTIWMWICGSLVHVNKNCRKLQILIGIIPIFSENFIQNKQMGKVYQQKFHGFFWKWDLANFTILEDVFYSCTLFKGLHLIFINFTCDFKMALAPLFD